VAEWFLVAGASTRAAAGWRRAEGSTRGDRRDSREMYAQGRRLEGAPSLFGEWDRETGDVFREGP